MKTIPFRNDDAMPALGLGTWKSKPGEVYAAVKAAVRLGYRHLDCAAAYANEAEIGQALSECFSEGLVSRADMWITSKLWNDAHAPDAVIPALEKTLKNLQLEYLDLYLVHWPVALRPGVFFPRSPDDLISLDELPIAATWERMEAAVDQGLCRHIGVSNFSVARLRELMDSARIKPEANQVEMHPYLQQPALLAFCRENDICVTAYSPLGSLDRPSMLKAQDEPMLLEDPRITAIAGKHQVTAAQVLLAWALERGTSVIPKSVNPERMRENLAAADVRLDREDMQAIAALDRDYRYVTGKFWAIEGSPYTMADLWGD